jgi:hypothetical protein
MLTGFFSFLVVIAVTSYSFIASLGQSMGAFHQAYHLAFRPLDAFHLASPSLEAYYLDIRP